LLVLFLAAGMQVAHCGELSEAGRNAAWDALDKSLQDGAAEHRQQALAALSTMGDMADAVKRAEGALRDKDTLVRQSAALALGEMKAKAAIPSLQAALDDSPPVAFAAAKALMNMGDRSGEQMLISVLAGERKDSEGIMTNAMRKAKSKLRHPQELIFMGAQDATGAMFGPVSAVFPAVKDTVELKGNGVPGRAAAAAYLVKDPDPYAIALLEWALADESQFVRLEAAKGLGQRGNAASIPKLQALLGDPHTMVRDMSAASILRILDRSGEAGAVPEAAVIISAPAKK
jgi:HEAT repeat protein